MKRIRLYIVYDPHRGFVCDSHQLAGTPWVGIGETVIEAINSWFAGIGDNYHIVGVDSEL